MPDALYERDFYAWTVREASLLQRLAQGDRVAALIVSVRLPLRVGANP